MDDPVAKAWVVEAWFGEEEAWDEIVGVRMWTSYLSNCEG